MAYLARNIDAELLKWKESPRRKPLIVRGATNLNIEKRLRHFDTASCFSFITIFICAYFRLNFSTKNRRYFGKNNT